MHRSYRTIVTPPKALQGATAFPHEHRFQTCARGDLNLLAREELQAASTVLGMERCVTLTRYFDKPISDKLNEQLDLLGCQLARVQLIMTKKGSPT